MSTFVEPAGPPPGVAPALPKKMGLGTKVAIGVGIITAGALAYHEWKKHNKAETLDKEKAKAEYKAYVLQQRAEAKKTAAEAKKAAKELKEAERAAKKAQRKPKKVPKKSANKKKGLLKCFKPKNPAAHKALKATLGAIIVLSLALWLAKHGKSHSREAEREYRAYQIKANRPKAKACGVTVWTYDEWIERGYSGGGNYYEEYDAYYTEQTTVYESTWTSWESKDYEELEWDENVEYDAYDEGN
ncbi:hypothetical protein BC830DRAFT_584819 [Chytriomyces sp. MP71]|nr:hypothetical protein BC830DRAFT_584819 [Chytriomyces sp. MP71]